MIAELAVTLAIAGTDASPNAVRLDYAALKACPVRSLAEASDCIDETLSLSDRRSILAASFSDAPATFRDAVDDIESAWLSSPRTKLATILNGEGLVGSTDQAAFVLQTYWLREHGCDIDVARRANLDAQRIATQAKAEAYRRETKDVDFGPENESLVFGWRIYRPKCPSFVRGAQ